MLVSMHTQQREKSSNIKLLLVYIFLFVIRFFSSFLTESVIIMAKRYSFCEQCNAIVELHASFICSSFTPPPSLLSSSLFSLSVSVTSTQNSIFLISKFQSFKVQFSFVEFLTHVAIVSIRCAYSSIV